MLRNDRRAVVSCLLERLRWCAAHDAAARWLATCLVAGLLSAPLSAQGAGGHNWGLYNPIVTATSQTTHNNINALAGAAASLGFNVPGSASGSAGSTKYDGTEVYQFDTTQSPDGNSWSGQSSVDPNGAFALDISLWGTLAPPIDYKLLVEFVATIYHEKAHLAYVKLYEAWKLAHPGEAATFEACLQGLTNPDGTSKGYHVPDANPCSEANASSTEFASLCADKLTICANQDLSATEKQHLLNVIDQALEAARQACNKYVGDCQACGGSTVPPGCASCSSNQACLCP